ILPHRSVAGNNCQVPPLVVCYPVDRGWFVLPVILFFPARRGKIGLLEAGGGGQTGRGQYLLFWPFSNFVRVFLFFPLCQSPARHSPFFLFHRRWRPCQAKLDKPWSGQNTQQASAPFALRHSWPGRLRRPLAELASRQPGRRMPPPSVRCGLLWLLHSHRR